MLRSFGVDQLLVAVAQVSQLFGIQFVLFCFFTKLIYAPAQSFSLGFLACWHCTPHGPLCKPPLETVAEYHFAKEESKHLAVWPSEQALFITIKYISLPLPITGGSGSAQSQVVVLSRPESPKLCKNSCQRSHKVVFASNIRTKPSCYRSSLELNLYKACHLH